MVIGLMILSIPAIALWGAAMRALEQERRITYRIPVRVATA
jgi:hypothetical protein